MSPCMPEQHRCFRALFKRELLCCCYASSRCCLCRLPSAVPVLCLESAFLFGVHNRIAASYWIAGMLTQTQDVHQAVVLQICWLPFE